MIRTLRILLIAVCTLSLATCSAIKPGETHEQSFVKQEQARVLIFSHSTGWRHKSIETGVEALKALGAREGYEMVATEDPAIFSTESLKDFDAIILLNTTADGKTENSYWFVGERKAAFKAFVQNGGGIVGIHAATDSHYDWPWYGKMIGGYFKRHPKGTPTGTLTVVNADHPSTADIPTEFVRTDEWYYVKDFNTDVTLLVTIDPVSIGQPDEGPQPVAWFHEYDGGRVFYTSMGHTNETYAEPIFLSHVAGGLHWVLGE